MIHGVREPVVAGLPPDNDPALAGSLGDRRNSCQTAQCGVVTPLQGIEGFCKQRGEDDSSHSRQGCKDLHVMLLFLPRLGPLGWDQVGGQGVELLMRLPELPVHETDARNQRGDMSAGGLGRSGGDVHRRRAQHLKHMATIETADTVALEKLPDCCSANMDGLVWCGYGLPQIEEPFRPKIAFELKHRGKIAPELLAQAICEPIAFRAEVLGDARPFAQFDDNRIGTDEGPEATRIGTQTRGHYFGVATIVFGARKREPITKAIHLLRVDSVNFEPALNQGFDHGTMWYLNRDLDLERSRRAADHHQPGGHIGEALAAVFEASLGDFSTISVREEHMMVFRRPIDAGIPLSLIVHAFSSLEHTSHRDLRRSLYWRSENQVRRRLPTGPRSRPIRRGTCPPQVVRPQGAIGRSRRIGSVLAGYAALDRRPQVTLRSATLHFARPAACMPKTA